MAQICSQKFQTLVQNIGNYWPKQSFTFFQFFSWFGSSSSAGTHRRTDEFRRCVKQGRSQSFHTSMIKWVWPVHCWTERPQLPRALQFIWDNCELLPQAADMTAGFFCKTVFFLFSKKLSKTSNHIARSCEKQLVLKSTNWFSSSLHNFSAETCWQMERKALVPTALHHWLF